MKPFRFEPVLTEGEAHLILTALDRYGFPAALDLSSKLAERLAGQLQHWQELQAEEAAGPFKAVSQRLGAWADAMPKPPFYDKAQGGAEMTRARFEYCTAPRPGWLQLHYSVLDGGRWGFVWVTIRLDWWRAAGSIAEAEAMALAAYRGELT